MMLDFIRIACAVPDVAVANVEQNAQEICKYIAEADGKNVDVLVFPELCLTGASCGDLFFEDALHKAVKKGLHTVAECCGDHPEVTVVVGFPLRLGMQLLNCAAVIYDGCVSGITVKNKLTGEEKRWFTAGENVVVKEIFASTLGLDGVLGATGSNYEIPMNCSMHHFGEADALASMGVVFGTDLTTPDSDASVLTLQGAEFIVALAAEPEVVGSRAKRQRLVKAQSEALNCVYAYCSAGMMESTQDGVYCGHSMIVENGEILAENKDFTDSGYLLVMDCDLDKVRALRRRNTAFQDAASEYAEFETEAGWIDWTYFRSDGSLYHLNKLPFIPETKAERDAYCREVFQIQVSGLKRRLKAINCNPVLGISGGLDSTLALLVAVEAVRQLGRDASTVYGITLPCFGTSDRTYRNAWDLMKKLGITSKEISIKNAVTQHFLDIGHDPENRNTTYENGQARERTQILMDYSSTVNGIVVGTGDLSELALGWCTYNGDHMSMYGVNASIPKTLIRWMIDAISEMPAFAAARPVLQDILDTPISPELLPPDAEGKIAQHTEDLVGPYALHDFFLYYTLRFGFTPTKIYTLACRAFEADFEPGTIKKWLVSFYRRFFTQQFKRSCMPDGVKVGSVTLSPRGDWRMPSDASAKLWLTEAEAL